MTMSSKGPRDEYHLLEVCVTTWILGELLASTAPSALTLNGPTWVLCRLNVPEAFGEGGCGKATRWRIIVAFGGKCVCTKMARTTSTTILEIGA